MWFIGGTLIGGTLIRTSTAGQSESGSNSNERVLQAPNLQNWSLISGFNLVSYPEQPSFLVREENLTFLQRTQSESVYFGEGYICSTGDTVNVMYRVPGEEKKSTDS